MKITMHAMRDKPETGIKTNEGGIINHMNIGWLIALLQAKLQNGTADRVDISETDAPVVHEANSLAVSLHHPAVLPVEREIPANESVSRSAELGGGRHIRAMVEFTIDTRDSEFAPATHGHQTWQAARAHAEQQMLFWQTIVQGIDGTMPRVPDSSTKQFSRRVFWVQELTGWDGMRQTDNLNTGWYELDGLAPPIVGEPFHPPWVKKDSNMRYEVAKMSNGVIEVRRIK